MILIELDIVLTRFNIQELHESILNLRY